VALCGCFKTHSQQGRGGEDDDIKPKIDFGSLIIGPNEGHMEKHIIIDTKCHGKKEMAA